jgi:propionyl-CoA synthetase
MTRYDQDEAHDLSLKDPERFWSRHCQQLYWHHPPKRMLERRVRKTEDGATYPDWTWFPDGEISTTYNCVDRHVHNGHGATPAIIWDSPVTKTKKTITYKQLLSDVEVFAAVLQNEGVKKGDVVIVYSECLDKSAS